MIREVNYHFYVELTTVKDALIVGIVVVHVTLLNGVVQERVMSQRNP